MPFELYIVKLCEKFHKLPSEILNEDLEWLSILSGIIQIENELKENKVVKEETSNILKERIK